MVFRLKVRKLQKYKLSHVHIWQYNSDDWIRHIALRDYLIEHPNDMLQYEELKKNLSEKEWLDGNEYNDEKNGFIKNLELKAILWYQNINQLDNSPLICWVFYFWDDV